MSELFNISESDLTSATSEAPQTMDVQEEIPQAPETLGSSSQSIASPTDTSSEESTNTVSNEAATEPEAVTETESQADSQEEVVESADKLNWDSAPEQFRNTYKEAKKELESLKNKLAESDSWQNEYFNNPEGLIEKLKSASPTQYNAIAQPIVTESANANPAAWAEFLVNNHWNAVAPALFGREISLEKVKEAITLTEDPEFPDLVFDEEDAPKQPQAKPLTTDEIEKIVQKRLEERDMPNRVNELGNRVVGQVFKAVDEKLDEFGLKVKPEDPPEMEAWKEKTALNIRRDAMDILQGQSDYQRSAQAKVLFDKMNGFIGQLDENGALHNVPALQAILSEGLAPLAEIYLNKRAEQQKAQFQAPAVPPKVVGAGASQPKTPETKRVPFQITADDLAGASV